MSAKKSTGGKSAPARLDAHERRRKAWELRRQNKTFREIGQALGVSTQRAHKMVQAELTAARDRLTDRVEESVIGDLDALDDMQARLLPAALRHDLDTVDRVLKIMARRARILGYEAPNSPLVAVQINQNERALQGGELDAMTEKFLRQLHEVMPEVDRIAAGNPGYPVEPNAVERNGPALGAATNLENEK